MQRKGLLILLTTLSALLLTACGKGTLTTTKTTYHQDGMVAVVKGTTTAKDVTYQVAKHAKKTVGVRNGTFIIQVPTTAKKQSVSLHADDKSAKVTVAAAKPLKAYQALQTGFNQSLVGANLSQADQAKAKKVQQASAALKQQPTPELAATVSQLGPEVQSAMKVAKTKVDGKTLPVKTPADGLSNVVTTKGYKIRMNIQDGQAMSAAMIVSTDSFTQKEGQREFGESFVILANSVGADGTKVLKQFSDETKKLKKGANTIDPIYSHGVKFTVGLSTGDFYIYLTR